MNFIKITLILLCFTIYSYCKDEENLIDFNKFYNKLKKHSKIGIKTYLEVPDPDVLINSDSSRKQPCKLLNQTVHTVHMLDNWNALTISKYLISNFVFAEMTEVINKKPITTKTSLRRFLNQLDQYTYETKLNFGMPDFFQ